MAMEEKYDVALLGILQNEGKIETFLNVIMGFLYRRTDFYRIMKDKNDKLGFPKGVAINMLASVFKHYDDLTRKDDEEREAKRQEAERKKPAKELLKTQSTAPEPSLGGSVRESHTTATATSVSKQNNSATNEQTVNTAPQQSEISVKTEPADSYEAEGSLATGQSVSCAHNTSDTQHNQSADKSKDTESDIKTEEDTELTNLTMTTVSQENTLLCVYCGACLKTRSGFSKHIRRHKRDAPYSCCGKFFFSEDKLLMHRQQMEFQSNPDSYNGAVRDNYSWSQSITDVDLKVKVPPHVLKGKDCRVEIRKKHVKVAYKDHAGEWKMVVDGSLTWDVDREESMWSLNPGQNVHINFEKKEERWWEAVLVDEPKINVRKIDASRPMTDLDDEAQAKIEEMMYNDRRKKMGLPQSHEQKMHDTLRNAWDAEGSPFKGQPFDPSKFSVDPSGVINMKPN